jgi:multiple sugar transport system permease protein
VAVRTTSRPAVGRRRDEDPILVTTRRWSAMDRRNARTALLFLAPNLILVAVFLFIPVVANLGISFTDWDVVSEANPVGFANYTELLASPEFRQALVTTGVFTLITVSLTLVLSLALALLLDSIVYSAGAYRMALFIPYAMSGVVVGLMWRWFYNPEYGLLNYLLSFIGIQGPAWLNDPALALPSVAAVFIWQQVGFNMVLFLVVLREVPTELRWAARVDGAGWWRELFHVTLPLISPTTFFVVLNLSFIAFQTFDLAYVMTKGGPGRATTLVMQFIYDQAFGSFRLGYAAAAAFVYVAIIGLITMLAWATRRLWVLGED